MSERIIIETPENIAFGYDVAGLGSRFLAALVDSLIQGSLYLFLLIVALLLGFESALAGLPPQFTSLLPALVLLAAFLIWFGYYMAFEIFMNGQSPGKRLLNLRVIKENGYPLGVLASLIRNLVRVIDFMPFGYGLGVVVMFANERSKRLGDFAAGTLVVNVHEAVKLSELQAASARLASPAPAAAGAVPADAAAAAVPGVENLEPEDIDLVESYLLRRMKLQNAGSLGAEIAARVRLRLNGGAAALPSENGERPEVFLQKVVAAYRAAHTRR